MKKLFEEIPVMESERLILTKLTMDDSKALSELMHDEPVYEYLPTFLLERQSEDPLWVIDRMYGECIREKSALHLGIFEKKGRVFCGLVELYGYKENIHKISIGYRLKHQCWGRKIASESVRLMIDYLLRETDIEIITASVMPQNLASEKVLLKNGFERVVRFSKEDWGYQTPTLADKWIR